MNEEFRPDEELNIDEDIITEELFEGEDDDDDVVVGDYKNELLKIPPYTAEEERDAFLRLKKARKDGDTALCKKISDDIALHNMRLAMSVAGKIAQYTKSLTIEDLLIEGYIGLTRAVEEFDVDKGFKFSTYALYWIRQVITRAVMNGDDIIRIPVHVSQSLLNYNQMSEDEKREYLESASDAGSVKDALSVLSPISIDVPMNEDDKNPTPFSDFIEAAENVEKTVIEDTEQSRVCEIIRDAIDHYANFICKRSGGRSPVERTKDVLIKRYGLDGDDPMTLQQIGDLYDISRERVRQITDKFIYYMRHSSWWKELVEYTNDYSGLGMGMTEISETKAMKRREWAKREREYRAFLRAQGYDYVECHTPKKKTKENDVKSE